MSVQILGFKTVTAMPADFTPELDSEGYPVDDTITRAYTPVRYRRAMDGLEGGHEVDPLEPGSIGSRWYQLGECVGSTFNMSSSRLSMYRDELMEFSQVNGREFHEESPFFDIVEFNVSDGMLGPVACQRLAAAYKQHPWVADQGQVHQEMIEMIHEIAEHGGCLLVNG